MLERYGNSLILRHCTLGGLSPADLDAALSRAADTLAACDYTFNHREILNAVMSYRPGGKLLDLGGSGSIYHLILKNLGMDVAVLDFAFNPALKGVLASAGIQLAEGDLYKTPFPSGNYDVISTFECFEHLPHSPKPVMDKITAALKPGGAFVMSIPNVARIEQRLRLLMGATPHEKYEGLYHSGDYFAGHHREMTVREVRYLMAENNLALETLFTTDMTVASAKKRSRLKRALNRLNYQYLLTDKIMPRNLRKHIWAKARKAY